MSLQQVYLLLLAGAVVMLVSVVAARLAHRIGLPVLLAFLGVGVILGEDVLGLRFNNAALAQALGTAALAVILVEGGLNTEMSAIRPVLVPAAVLATFGVLVSVAVVAIIAHFALGMSWQLALLLGAIVSPTDAAAVFSVLRTIPLPRRLTGLLEAESGFNDAPAVILVVALSASALRPEGVARLLGDLVYELAAGALVGLAVGYAGVWLLRRLALVASGLHSIAMVATGILGFAAAGMVHASGFLAAYVAALILGNAGLPHRRATRSVAEGLGWIAQISVFVMLGLLATPHELRASLLPALAVGAVLLLLARPISVLLSLTPFGIPLPEQFFLSWAGLRGAVPIVLATIPIVAHVPGSHQLLNLVFVLVVIYTLLQAPTLPPLARRLGLVPKVAGRELRAEIAPLDTIDAELIELTIEPGSRLHGVEVFELRLPDPCAVALVVRDKRAFVPQPTTRLTTGDQLLVVATTAQREAVERRLRAVARAGRLASWFGETGDPDGPTQVSQ
ncbi:potassium/proton antiporter [Planosporangium flavigriseum]|uniref:Putative Na(+)/H(+) antiporter n=1 Tax=Planosporangium flavigriseum TaxID=373681 RepID=A0A8J3PPD7_9ACTN|nr:potassium/proton antiporter [Planosporangium flavigriseum]NJC66789.1 potassium/proton antiporter [Planosporangium flavigriseum]GIG76279.1 putative Na(+)/H(+) antiporter [Planosporangium flavigriseum]